MDVTIILIKINHMKYLFALSILLFIACDDEEPIKDCILCDDFVSISQEGFENASAPGLEIMSFTLNENCLTITYSSSGCDGETWELRLIDSATPPESDPEQRFARFDFENVELCDAIVTKETSFDISEIYLSGRDFILNLEAGEWTDEILIEEN